MAPRLLELFRRDAGTRPDDGVGLYFLLFQIVPVNFSGSFQKPICAGQRRKANESFLIHGVSVVFRRQG
jgi:hypothetical protein